MLLISKVKKRGLFPEGVFGKPKDENERKEIMKNVEKELKEKENYKPELTIIQKHEFFKVCKNGDLEKVKELLSKGADTNAKDDQGITALMYASEIGNTEIVKLLLHDSRTEINKKDNGGWTALMWASKSGNVEIAKILVNDSRIKINEKANSGLTALMCASWNGNIEIVELLLNDSRIEINEKANNGWTALEYGSERGFIEIVKLIKQHLEKQNSN